MCLLPFELFEIVAVPVLKIAGNWITPIQSDRLFKPGMVVHAIGTRLRARGGERGLR